MMLSRHNLLPVVIHGGIIACCALLAIAALKRIAPRHLFGLSLIYVVPVIVAATGVYIALGASSAISMLLASCVGATLFANGSAIVTRPGDLFDIPINPIFSLILPLAMILLLAGFPSQFTSASLIALSILGILSLDIMRDQPLSSESIPTHKTPALAILATLVPLAVIVGSSYQFVLQAQTGFYPLEGDTFIVCILTPLVVFPLVGRSMNYSLSGHLTQSLALTAGFTAWVSGICIPVLVGTDYLLRHSADEFANPIALPTLSWRLDIPLLLAGGFGLLGIRTGLLVPSRWIGFVMAILYGAYLILSVFLRLGR